MKASGYRTNSTVMDNSFGLMDQFIVGNIIKEKNKDTENLFGKIKVLTKDNLEIIKSMEMAFILGKMVEHTKVSGKTTK